MSHTPPQTQESLVPLWAAAEVDRVIELVGRDEAFDRIIMRVIWLDPDVILAAAADVNNELEKAR